MIGVVVGDVSDPFFSAMIGGIHTAAAGTGYMVTIVNTYRDPDTEIEAIRALEAQRVDVLIVAGSGLTQPSYQGDLERRIASFCRAKKSVVLIGRHHIPDDLPVGRITVDNVAAGRRMAEHLKSLGHERVALLSGDGQLLSTLDRTDATAIAATADQMALGALVALREEGISVPEDMSVAGFNDIEISKDLVPSLTSIHLPLREIGENSLVFGLKGLAGEVHTIAFAATLADRRSTAQVH